MPRTLRSAVNLIPTGTLEGLRRLLDRGLMLQAFQQAQTLGALPTWGGTEARCCAAQLCGLLGAPRLERRLFLRAHREAPAHPESFYHYVCLVLQSRGAWEGWQLLSKTHSMVEPSPRLRFPMMALRVRLAGHLRDFETADALLGKAEAFSPDPARVFLERSWLLQKQDRYEEALKSARAALSKQPAWPAAVQATAHLLQLLDRDTEALELLDQAARSLESSGVVAQLAQLHLEIGQPARVLECLDQFERFTPLRERAVSAWLTHKRAEAAYLDGKFAVAVTHARASQDPESEAFAKGCEALASRGGTLSEHRQLLSVPFVRQHHVTCAPATLTAISRFWGRAVEQQAVADQICYNGTAAHREREWAEQNGWIAREFRLTAKSAQALIGRGIPFGLATSGPRMGHMQAVAGYDSLRDALLIRDPYLRNIREFGIVPFLEGFRSSGPRALVLVPAERPELLDGLELDEAALYDRFHRLHLALDRK